MEAQGADSRGRETGLSRKELDEVVTQANQGPLGTDLDHTSQYVALPEDIMSTLIDPATTGPRPRRWR